MIASLNQSVVVLDVHALTPNGAIKTNVVSGTVRVYSVASGGAETELLSATALVEVATGHWRYIWEPATLAVGEYFAEYTMIDDDTIQTRTGEDLICRDIAVQTDLDLVKNVSAGRWRIYSNQMMIYADDDTTVLLRFNLFDADGNPAVENVRERVPV